ncbi:MAG: hypothetical protein JXM70_13940 [Pirellulales bacterium]|nr:hypothetical protein [Pirellulales bacterium]
MTNKITLFLLLVALLCMTATATANQVVFPHYHVWPYRQANIWPYYQARFCPYFQDHEWIDYQDYSWYFHQDHAWLYSRAYLWPYNRMMLRPVFVRPVIFDAALPSEGSLRIPVRSMKPQQPQPVVLKNYYLASKDKKETLPFWQGPKPLRLQNQFINGKKSTKKK